MPFSESLQNNDRKVNDDWWEYLKDKTLVLTEKLDGENQSVYKKGIFGSSHGAHTTNPWSRNMWERGGIYDQVKEMLKEEGKKNMIVNLDRKDIISLLTGSKPNYNVIDKIPIEFGSYVGGFVNDWRWNNISENVSYSDEQLYDLYLMCKNSWKLK